MIPRPTRPDPGLPEKKGIEPPPYREAGSERQLTEQIMVRLSAAMLDTLNADAVKNERTIAQTVRYAIRRYFAEDPVKAPKRRPSAMEYDRGSP